MLAPSLAVSLFWNMLAGKGVTRAGEGAITTSWIQGTIRAGQDF